MSQLLQQLGGLSAAEEFFALLGVDYDQAVVNVNRLHILKRFNQYMRTTASVAELDDSALRTTCKELLTRAYQDFVRSTPQQEKVFKVFQDAEGQQQVSLDKMRQSLPSQR
jgi:nitrogenase-stabilizing/protective protein